VNAGWIVLGVGIAIAIVTAAASWFRRGEAGDLGSVSAHWVNEQRLGQGHDSQR
jgi:hypothetical protein